jgi:soluble lytic murein transglycosylase-like protein
MFRLRHTALVSTFVLALGVGMAGGHARADIFTYTDSNGVVHFSNVPRGGSGVRRIRSEAPAPAPSRPRSSESVGERFDRYDPFIREAAALYRLPPSFLRAVMKVESNGNPAVVSHAGASGLMQLMPRTAIEMGVTDVFDPRQNILGGARLLRVLANTFNGDLVLVIAAYNAGPGAVLRYRGIPPYEETQRYVRRVLTWYYGFLEAEAQAQRLAAN